MPHQYDAHDPVVQVTLGWKCVTSVTKPDWGQQKYANE